MSVWEKMKTAVRRAAQRELELKIGDKPFNDPQIMGSPYDVHVEGTYLGWTSKEKCDELRKLYADTPSELRKYPNPTRWEMDEVATSVGIVVKKCRELEADLMMGGERVRHGVLSMRRELEMLHERVLMLEQEERAGV
jgi:hypothetical protein